MKYKKLLVFITCLLFVTVAVFCCASAFKVKDIELNVTSISNSPENVKGKCQEKLLEYADKNLIFLSSDEIKTQLEDLSGYIEVKSVSKKFPNKVLVDVVERKEAFTLSVGETKYALDDKLTVLSVKQNIKNNVDGLDNITLILNETDYDFSSVEIGKPLSIYDGVTNAYLLPLLDDLYLLRADLSSAEVTVKKDGHYLRTLKLTMREGVTFTIESANEATNNKLTTAYAYYQELPLKTSGNYFVVLEDSGKISIKT